MKNYICERKKIVCYSCCTGGYDNILQHKIVNPNWDYVFFTDDKKLIKQKHVGQWQIKPLVFNKLTNVKNARWHKVNAHILFPEYDASLWLDANLIINSKNVLDKIDSYVKNNTLLAVPLHPERTCIYQEAEKIIDLKIDYPEIVNEEMNFLKDNNYPADNGLHETCIMFRQHNKIESMLELWWDMIERFSKRDQLSFDYAVWKKKLKVEPFYPNGRMHHENLDFKFSSGKKHNQDKITLSGFKIYRNIEKNNGCRQIYFCGIKILSYKKKLLKF